MSYQNPKILYFLFAIAIPIFIHLFNLRKHKVVYFSNITFLKKIQSEKKKRNTLKQLLILLSRILAISAIVFAFANPYIPNSSKNQSVNNTIIYIDNSFSMDNRSEKGRLLNLAKENALEILNSYNDTNKFYILTNNFSATEYYPKNKKQAKEFISNIKLSSKIKNTNNILDQIKPPLFPENNTLYIISDFQKSSTNLNLKDSIHNLDSNQSVIFIPTLSKKSNTNISIDNCYLNSPLHTKGNPTSISTIISNHSDKKKEISVNLKINNIPKIIPKEIILLPNEQHKLVELKFLPEKGMNNGSISIEDKSITYDNEIYFHFNLDEKINVCQIYGRENKNITKIFTLNKEEFNYTKYTDEDSISYNYDLIILNQLNEFHNSTEIKSYIEKGGNVCIIPEENANITFYNLLLKKLQTDQFTKEVSAKIPLSKIEMDHPLNKGVFSTKTIKDDANLPIINNYYKLKNNSNSNKKNVFSLENDDEFLNSYELGQGKIYLFNSPLSEKNNNFCNHKFFVTTLLNMAVNTPNLYYIINKDSKIKLPNSQYENKNNFYLQGKDNKKIICEYRNKDNQSYLSTYNHIKDAGHYELLQEDQVIQTISYNYDRSESNTEQFTEEVISDHIKNIENVQLFSSDVSINQNIENLYKNKGFWKVLVLLSLLFITIEILLIKTKKT